jgi:hypothetical protein
MYQRISRRTIVGMNKNMRLQRLANEATLCEVKVSM